MALENASKDGNAESSPQRDFSIAHAEAVRDAALRMLEASEALLTLLDEEIEETIDVTGSLSRIQDQLNSLLGGDKERQLRSKLGVTKKDLGIDRLPPIPSKECDPDEPIRVKHSVGEEFPEGVTCDKLRKPRPKPKKQLSPRQLAQKQLREYYAELALLRRKNRERREIRDLVSGNPFKTNSTRDDSVYLTHGLPNKRPR